MQLKTSNGSFILKVAAVVVYFWHSFPFKLNGQLGNFAQLLRNPEKEKVNLRSVMCCKYLANWPNTKTFQYLYILDGRTVKTSALKKFLCSEGGSLRRYVWTWCGKLCAKISCSAISPRHKLYTHPSHLLQFFSQRREQEDIIIKYLPFNSLAKEFGFLFYLFSTRGYESIKS